LVDISTVVFAFIIASAIGNRETNDAIPISARLGVFFNRSAVSGAVAELKPEIGSCRA
jgi:hypothetical protein